MVILYETEFKAGLVHFALLGSGVWQGQMGINRNFSLVLVSILVILLGMYVGVTEFPGAQPANESSSLASVTIIEPTVHAGELTANLDDSPNKIEQTNQHPVAKMTLGEQAFASFESPVIPLSKQYGSTTTRPFQSPIDQFVEEFRQGETGHDTYRPAEKSDLIQRVYLDITGLKPQTAELELWINDQHPDWYPKLVDYLLASPRFGEHWGSFWLDLARYADSDGFEKDPERPYAWTYRDWVIEALNADLPYDQFGTYQLAGDLVPDATENSRIATGFLRNAPSNREGGTDPKQNRFYQLVDQTNTCGTVFLGLSMACAQCHDHLIEPVTQKEYFQLMAFFEPTENIQISINGSQAEQKTRSALEQEYSQARANLLEQFKQTTHMQDWEEKLRETANHPHQSMNWDNHWLRLKIYLDCAPRILFTPAAERTMDEQDQLLGFYLKETEDILLPEERIKLGMPEAYTAFLELKQRFALPQAMIVRQVASQGVHLYHRGDYYQPHETVTAGVPACLPELKSNTSNPPDRRQLAGWLFGENRLLTSRVMVNRIWQQLMSQGLVNPADAIGVQSEIHPQELNLLNYLAHDFIAHEWSIKSLIRQIVLSSTYTQSAENTNLTADGGGVKVWSRYPHKRLTAEMIRDNMLHTAGLLDQRLGGPSVRPFLPAGVTDLQHSPDWKWQISDKPDAYARGIYIHRQRTVPYPQLDQFDAPTRVLPMCQRSSSITPLQALNLLNDPVFMEIYGELAHELCCTAPVETTDKIRHFWQKILLRLPNDHEIQAVEHYMSLVKTHLQKQPPMIQLLTKNHPNHHQRLDLACWTMLVRSLCNLDEYLHVP